MEVLRQHEAAAPIQQERDTVTTELDAARVDRDAATAERALVVATPRLPRFHQRPRRADKGDGRRPIPAWRSPGAP